MTEQQEQIDQVVDFQKNDRVDVKTQAVDIISGLVAEPTNWSYLEKTDFIKRLSGLLYEEKLCHQANLCLLTCSQHDQFVKQMVEAKVMSPFQQIVFNVMKQLKNEDLQINKQILIDKNSNRENILQTEEKDGVQYKTMHINNSDTIGELEIIPVVNQENLRFSLLNISNMCCLSADARNQFLEGNSETTYKFNNFHIFLDWYLMNQCENLFDGFAYIITTLSSEPVIRNLMIKDGNKVEHKIKKYLLHKSNKIRQNTIKSMRNFLFEYEDDQFCKRFSKFDTKEPHIYELLARALYICGKQGLAMSEADIKAMDNVLGSFWVSIPSIASENVLEMDYKEEAAQIIECIQVTTNIDWNKYIDSPLAEEKCIKELLDVQKILEKYVNPEASEKINIINQLFVGNVMLI